MDDRAGRSGASIPVNESTLRLAESIAARYGVTVGDLIDMLLLEFVHRADDVSIPRSPRRTAAVIDLASRRQRRV